MPVTRSTQARNWSYSRVFPAVEMMDEAGRHSAFATATDAWEASAITSGFRIKKGVQPTEAMTPMWLDANGEWTEVNPGDGTETQGFKVTITGPTG